MTRAAGRVLHATHAQQFTVIVCALWLVPAAYAQVPLGHVRCVGSPSSTGAHPVLRAYGDPDPSQNDLELHAAFLPAHALVLGLVGRTGGHVPLAGGTQGTLCVGADYGRLDAQVLAASATGAAQMRVDLTQLPGPAGPYAIVRGDSLHFQLWYRDAGLGGPAISNVTGSVAVTFAPAPWFANAGVSSVLSFPLAELADCDGDGLKDVVGTSFLPEGLAVSFARGDGSFEPAVLLDHISGASRAFPLHIDADGSLDYLVATSAGETFLVRGATPFGSGVTVPAPFSRSGAVVAVDDHDGDGAEDALLEDAVTGQHVLYHGDGAGGFLEVGVLPSIAPFTACRYLDVDLDGDRDFVFTASNHRDLQIVRDLGGGLFGQSQVVGFPSSTFSHAAVAADVDGDGYLDLVACGAGFVSVRRNRGDGTFWPESRFAAPTSAHLSQGFVGGEDVDGDQDLDLYVQAPSQSLQGGSDLHLMENVGGGVLRVSSASVGVVRGDRIHLADLDGQGALDLIGVQTSSNGLFGALSTGPATFEPAAADALRLVRAGHVQRATLGDVDGDGAAECVATVRRDGTWSTLVAVDVGSAGAPELGQWRVPALTAPHCADMDGDGRDDLVYDTVGGVAVVSLQSPGQFVPVIPILAGIRGPVTTSDLDGDGDLDLVGWALQPPDTLVAVENEQGASLIPRPHWIPSASSMPTAVVAADMDGDGDPDLIGASSNTTWVGVYENLGSGQFAARIEYSASGVTTRLLATDLDGDGDQDVARYINEDLGEFLWNDGAGALTTSTSPVEVGAVTGLGDLDGDGAADQVGVSNPRRITVAYSIGMGQFEPRFVLPTTGFNASPTQAQIHFGDLDGDGDVDVTVTNPFGIHVALSQLR